MIGTNDIFDDKIEVLEYFPNPAKEDLIIKISSDKFNEIKIVIYDNLE